MRKVIVLEHIYIDDVIQAPGGPAEDTNSGASILMCQAKATPTRQQVMQTVRRLDQWSFTYDVT